MSRGGGGGYGGPPYGDEWYSRGSRGPRGGGQPRGNYGRRDDGWESDEWDSRAPQDGQQTSNSTNRFDPREEIPSRQGYQGGVDSYRPAPRERARSREPVDRGSREVSRDRIPRSRRAVSSIRQPLAPASSVHRQGHRTSHQPPLGPPPWPLPTEPLHEPGRGRGQSRDRHYQGARSPSRGSNSSYREQNRTLQPGRPRRVPTPIQQPQAPASTDSLSQITTPDDRDVQRFLSGFSGQNVDCVAEIQAAEHNLDVCAKVAYAIRQDSLLSRFFMESGAFEPLFRLIQDQKEIFRHLRAQMWYYHQGLQAELEKLTDAEAPMADKREKLPAELIKPDRHGIPCPVTMLLRIVANALSAANLGYTDQQRPGEPDDRFEDRKGWGPLLPLRNLLVNLCRGLMFSGPNEGTTSKTLKGQREADAGQSRNARSRNDDARIAESKRTHGSRTKGATPIPPLKQIMSRGRRVVPGVSGCILLHWHGGRWNVTSSTPQWVCLPNLQMLAKSQRDTFIGNKIASLPARERVMIAAFDTWSRTVYDTFNDRGGIAEVDDPSTFLDARELREVEGVIATFKPDGGPMRTCLTDYHRLKMNLPPDMPQDPLTTSYPPRSCAEYQMFIESFVRGLMDKKDPGLVPVAGRRPPPGQKLTPSPPRASQYYDNKDLQGGHSFSGRSSLRETVVPGRSRQDRLGATGEGGSGHGFGRPIDLTTGFTDLNLGGGPAANPFAPGNPFTPNTQQQPGYPPPPASQYGGGGGGGGGPSAANPFAPGNPFTPNPQQQPGYPPPPASQYGAGPFGYQLGPGGPYYGR